jgi:acyl-CoA dehydrogenase
MMTLEAEIAPLHKFRPIEDSAVEARSDDPANLEARAAAVATVAAASADSVDREGRFPEAAIAAARAQRLMGIMVPRTFGGEDAGLSDIVDVCYRLGRACASTAMIYAMHQTQVACLVRHGRKSAWHERLLRRLCSEQLLLASSTTEGQGGGDVRSSTAAPERNGSRIRLERRATVISYGAYADGIVTTARRSPDAAASDQVLIAFLKEDYSLERFLAWDTLGMRGTCSEGFTLRAEGDKRHILPVPYEKVHVQTMVPVAHLTWAGVWTGAAAAAVERAQFFLRKAARQANGQLPPGAPHFVKATASLRTLRGLVASAVKSYEAMAQDERLLGSLEFQAMINLTKVEASELAVAIVMSALRACGLSGYRNDGEFSIGRYLRDVLSSPIMINNDRILANASGTALLGAVPQSIRS